MEPTGIDYFGIVLKVLATSGAAAWIAAFLSNKRGQNKVLDFIMDAIELIGGNINKAKNDPNA
jgi:hypothetical protein